MTVDTRLVTDLRTEVLAALSERERGMQAAGRAPLGTADEQALGRQLIAEARWSGPILTVAGEQQFECEHALLPREACDDGASNSRRFCRLGDGSPRARIGRARTIS